MSMEEFLLDHPWAADIPKSRLLMELVRFLEKPRKLDEIDEAFPKLSDDDVAYAIYVLKEIGVVSGDGERIYLTELGKKFLEEFENEF